MDKASEEGSVYFPGESEVNHSRQDGSGLELANEIALELAKMSSQLEFFSSNMTLVAKSAVKTSESVARLSELASNVAKNDRRISPQTRSELKEDKHPVSSTTNAPTRPITAYNLFYPDAGVISQEIGPVVDDNGKNGRWVFLRKFFSIS